MLVEYFVYLAPNDELIAAILVHFHILVYRHDFHVTPKKKSREFNVGDQVG